MTISDSFPSPLEMYIHIIILGLFTLLTLMSGYSVCISSINDQPRIKYRFQVMLFCFVEFIITILSTLYIIITYNSDDMMIRSSLSLLIRLCQPTGRIIGILCAYSFLLTIIKSLYRIPWHHNSKYKYNNKLPNSFRAFVNIFCILIMLLDIITTLVSFIISDLLPKNLFYFILIMWLLIFDCVIFLSLIKVFLLTKNYLKRATKPNSNKYVMSPRNKHQINPNNPVSPKNNSNKNTLNINNTDMNSIIIPASVNFLDIDKTIKSSSNLTYISHLRKKLIKIRILLYLCLLIFFILLLCGIYYLKYYDHNQQLNNLKLNLNIYYATNILIIIYIIILLYWLYVPHSICCDNIAIDSACFICCKSFNCFFELRPSDFIDNTSKSVTKSVPDTDAIVILHGQEGLAKFMNDDTNNLSNYEESDDDEDFFNVDTWRSTFRITTWRHTSNNHNDDNDDVKHNNNDNDDSNDGADDDDEVVDSDFSIPSDEDKDYRDYITRRSNDLPNMNFNGKQAVNLKLRKRQLSSMSTEL